LDLAAEVEEQWAAELRGEAKAAPQNPVRSESYNLHAMHTLLVTFPLVPKPAVRSAFFKAASFQAAQARLQSFDGIKQLKTARKESNMPPPPVEVPLALAKEIAFPAVEIERALAARREDRERRLGELKESGGLCTCSCCFDDEVLPEEAILCDGQTTHSFCRSCVKNLAQSTFGSGLFAQNFQQACRASSSASASTASSSSGGPSASSGSSSNAGGAAFDLSMATLCCPDISGCSGRFFEGDLSVALPSKDYKRYTSRSAALHALASGLSDLVPCPSCEFMVEMSDLTDDVIRCLSPECGRVSCRWCGEPDHRPLRCDQVEKDSEVKLRTFMEEQMTDAMTRRCPQCQKAYERTEGCNKMHCPCGTTFCYLCGELLDNKRCYDHFADGHIGGGVDKKNSRCTVYGTPSWAKQSASAVKDRAEKALQEYLAAHPELQGLGGERIRNIKRSVGLTDEPTPSRKRLRPSPKNGPQPQPQPKGLLQSVLECSIQ
jgi:TRIAD3 protein (E3 ubiquitin-protein ligase RNF216)